MMHRMAFLALALFWGPALQAQDFPDSFIDQVKVADTRTVREWYADDHEFVVLDVRTPKEFRKDGHVPGSVNHSYTLRDRDRHENKAMLKAVADAYDKDTTLVIMCSHGMRATQAAWELQSMGFTDARVYPGGFEGHHMGGYPGGDGWKDAGLPLED